MVQIRDTGKYEAPRLGLNQLDDGTDRLRIPDPTSG